MKEKPEITQTLEHVGDLKPHPKNYRKHPAEQLAHIKESISRHGLYRNVVIAKDGTILAGHGVVEACKELGIERVPVVRLNIDPESPTALKVLTGDNEIGHLGEVDDRLLSEILKSIKDQDVTGLAGTGFDDGKLAELMAGIAEPVAPKTFPSVDESIPVEHRCPKCGYAWSGKTS